MLHSKSVSRTMLVLALVAGGCVSSRPVDPGRETGPAEPAAPDAAVPNGPVDADDLFARLDLELHAAWREGNAVVLDIQERRAETPVPVLAGFDGAIVGELVYLTPRYTDGVSGRRQRFRTRFEAAALPQAWQENVYLALGPDLEPLEPGAPSGPILRQHVVLGARILR